MACQCKICGDTHTWRAPLHWDSETAWLHYVMDPAGLLCMNEIDLPAYRIMRDRWFNRQIDLARAKMNLLI